METNVFGYFYSDSSFMTRTLLEVTGGKLTHR